MRCSAEGGDRLLIQLINFHGRDRFEFELRYRCRLGAEHGDEGVVAEVTTAAGDDDEVAGLELVDGIGIGE